MGQPKRENPIKDGGEPSGGAVPTRSIVTDRRDSHRNESHREKRNCTESATRGSTDQSSRVRAIRAASSFAAIRVILGFYLCDPTAKCHTLNSVCSVCPSEIREVG